MSGASETSYPWATNPYVRWRHPVARLIAVMLLILLDICVYGTDPINESRVESNMPGIGSLYNFLLRLPSNGARLCSRLGLIFLSCSAGLYVGRQWLHHWCLRDMCGLSMFAGTSGSFLTMGLGVVGACLLGGAIYNSIVPHGALRVTGETEMEARTFGKFLQVSSAVAHAVAAVQVADGVMQDRQRYPNWGSHLKRHWRRSLRGCLRILCAWAAAVALLGIFLSSIFGATGAWGESNEISRVFFASSLLFFDLFAVVQDWEFPTFQPPSGLDKPILMAGSFSPFFRCGAGSRLLHFAKTGVWDASAPPPGCASQSGTDKFFNVTISGPWLAYGSLFFAACLDLVALLTQLLYSPEDYGQYVDPSTSRIWTIADNSYLGTAYQSGVLQRSDLVTWAARRNAVTGLPLSASVASDVLCSASFSGASMGWKVLAASPGLLMLAAFVPLLIFAEWSSRHPNARPPLLEVAPEPEESEAPLCAGRDCRRLCEALKALCEACRGLCGAPWHRRTRVQPLPPKPTLAPLPPPSLTPMDDESGCIEEFATSPRGTYRTTLTSPPPRSLPQWGSPIGFETPPGFRLKDVLQMGFELPHKQEGEIEFQGLSLDVSDLESGLQAPLNSISEVGLQAGDQIVEALEQPPLPPPFAEEESPVSLRNPAETGLEVADQSAVDAGFLAHNLFPPSLMRHIAKQRASLSKTSEAETQPVLVDASDDTIYGETGSRPTSASSQGNSSVATSSRATSSHVKRMTSKEPHVRARQRAIKRLDEAGHFDVLLRKQGRPLGLSFKLPDELSSMARSEPSLQLTVAPDELETCPEVHAEECADCDETVIPDETDIVDRTLLVMDISETGVADEHNRAQAAAGQWDRVILPGMHISSVNGIRRDPLAMANALSKAKVLTIRFHYLRSTDLDGDPLQINGKAERLLEERVSKLVRMEGPQIVDSMRSQAEWEAMAASLAAALVKEVYKGDRLLQPWPQQSMAMLPAGVPTPPDIPAPQCVDSLRRLPLPSLPQGLPPLLPAPACGNREQMISLGELDELSDSEESV